MHLNMRNEIDFKLFLFYSIIFKNCLQQWFIKTCWFRQILNDWHMLTNWNFIITAEKIEHFISTVRICVKVEKQIYFWYFFTKDIYSSTSSWDPTTKGTLWWTISGFTSRIRCVPVVAIPPACSIRKAMGLHSYSSRSFKQRKGSHDVYFHIT